MSIGHKFEITNSGDKAQVMYSCAVCGSALFTAEAEFEAGCGFPSFWNHIGDHVRRQALNTYGRERTQLVCGRCGAHLGHLFDHPRTPTNVRYCISSSAITKQGASDTEPTSKTKEQAGDRLQLNA